MIAAATPLQVGNIGSDKTVNSGNDKIDRLREKLFKRLGGGKLFNSTQLHQIIAVVQDTRNKAEKGVDYTASKGAICPVCVHKLKIIRSEPWQEGTKIRFHKCDNQDCLLSHLKLAIKSIQIEKE